MRRIAPLLLLVLAAGAAWAQGPASVEDVHSPSVQAVAHEPAAPARGTDVHVSLKLVPGASPRNVTLTYCRVENYACALPVAMNATSAQTHEADIPWREGFFRGVESVGYAFILRFADGASEHSPIANWPFTPEKLPSGIDATYYFYSLPPVKAVDGAGTALLVVAAVTIGILSRDT